MALARPQRSFPAGLPDAVEMQLSMYARSPAARAAADPLAAADARRSTMRPKPGPWSRCIARWAIEQLFRTLKDGGFDIEGLRIEDPPARPAGDAARSPPSPSSSSSMPRRWTPDRSDPARRLPPEDGPLLEAFCAKLEGKTNGRKTPPKGSLAYAAWVCARLGGWTGYYGSQDSRHARRLARNPGR